MKRWDRREPYAGTFERDLLLGLLLALGVALVLIGSSALR